jgi:hypothetical protein
MPGFRDDYSEPPITRRTGNEPQRREERSTPEDFELYDSTRDREPANPDGTRYDAARPDAMNRVAVDPDAVAPDATDVDAAVGGLDDLNEARTRRTNRNVLTTGAEDRQASEPGRRSKFASKFEEELDRSRKLKLWQRSNWIGSVMMVFILLLAYLNICSDVRGEYGGFVNGARGGMIICSVTHGDGVVSFNLLLPDRPMMNGEIPEDKVGQNVEVLLKPRFKRNNTPDMGFKGKIDPYEINGLAQEGLHLYPVSLKKDALASVVQQLRALIPGANRQIDMNSMNAMHNGAVRPVPTDNSR